MRSKVIAIYFLFLALVSFFFVDKPIAWGPITHMTILDDVLKDSRLNQDVRKVLQENLKHAKGGATGPDMYYFIDKRYADIAHYCSPGDFARRMLEMAKKDGDPNKIAFAYGWIIHVATDPIGHGWVNSLAGGEYDPENSEVKSAHRNIEQSIDKKNLLDHGKPRTDPKTGMILYYDYKTDIDSPDIFNFQVFSSYFGCRENAPTADVGEIAENIAQLVYNEYSFWIFGKNENQYNTAEYQKSYQDSVSAGIDALNSSGGTLENWDLDTGEAQYIRDITGNIIPNPNYGGYKKCNDFGKLKDCGPVTKSSPGGDHPDDTVSVSGSSATDTISLDSLYRLAPKKGKKWVLWLKSTEDANAEYNSLPPDAPPELVQEKIDKISALFSKLNDPSNWREFLANNPQFFNEIEEVPDIAVLENGYFEEMTGLINKRQEPVRMVTLDFSPKIVENQRVLVIPSGGLYGLENSEIFRASLDEYVKNGGTLIVFAQQHGYEFSVLPVPQEEDGSYKTIGGYGWSEDQSCFVNAAYIETWHQILVGQSKSTPTLHLDGYFTSYPLNATVLLRRTANGQPALFMYEYGQGRVIVTSMYSDHASKLNQASSEEIAFIRDMISWAKKPDELPEVKPIDTVSVSVETVNATTNDASSVKLSIYDPDRTTLLSEQTVSISIPSGQSATIPVTYNTTQTSTLGIYHVDYTLLDAQGNIIQPQAETDSGRFVVSNPPQNPAQVLQLTFSIQSDSEEYIWGATATFTIIAFNNSETERTVTAKYDNINQNLIVPAKGSTSLSYSKSAIGRYNHYGHLYDSLWVSFYEGSKFLKSSSKIYWVYQPSPSLTVQTNKTTYAKGETVTINASVQNDIFLSWQAVVKISIKDPYYKIVFEDEKVIDLPPYGSSSVVSNFYLPTTLMTGYYFVEESLSNFYALAYTSFEVPQSQISVTPNVPSAIPSGSNTIPFNITNTGSLNISSGVLDVSLKDPDGVDLYSGSYLFTVRVGETKTLNVPVSLSSLKFGNYTLTYTQSDETRTGNPTTITIPNNVSMALSLDKTAYRVREMVNLTVGLTNNGKFNLENISVKVEAPDLNYTETQTISLGINPNTTSLNFSIPVPETVTSGQHNVDVTVALSSGANFTKSTTLTVPESSLAIAYSGADTVRAGDTINLMIENTGGVDTTYTTEKMSITDRQGLEIYQWSTTGTILAGEKKSFVDIQIPLQAINGPAFLFIQIKDSKTVKKAYLFKPLEVVGIIANLETRTDKDAYFKTEAVTGITNITNGSSIIEGGSLRVAVRATTSGFKHFLPKVTGPIFNYPWGIAVGPDGSVYVVDTDKHRIQKFDSNGGFIIKWGGFGWGNGQFYYPAGITVGYDGSVYVVDTDNHRIQKFDSSGTFLTTWGTEGSANEQFYQPFGIAISSDGYVYVADTRNHRVQKFDSNGNFISKWGGVGWGDGQFCEPYGIGVGPDGYVYVADTYNGRIQKFNANGQFITKWGSSCIQDGQFYWPCGIAVGSDGSVYVTDAGSDRIQKFSSSGAFITKWGSYGIGDGEFYSPSGIAIVGDNFVYVTDSGNNRVQKFASNGIFIGKWGSGGERDGTFAEPSGVAIGPDGSIYVTDIYPARVQKFDATGNFLIKWGTWGYGYGEFETPSSIAVGSDGSVYVADRGNNLIHKSDSNGNFILAWEPDRSEYLTVSPKGIAVGPDGLIYVVVEPIDYPSDYEIQTFDSYGYFLTKWGVLPFSKGIAIGPDGLVYVVTPDWNLIQKFGMDGNYMEWGSYGTGDGEFDSPQGISVGADGYIYVTDTGNHRIQKFDSNGNFIAKWGGYGWGDGQFDQPSGIAVGSDGSIFVVDTMNYRIQRTLSGAETIFEATLPINQPANTTQDYITNIGTLDATGKLYLEATLKNSLGQTVAEVSYPFYIVEGDTILIFSTDKKVYKPGEVVTITGQIENRASIDAVGLVFSFHSKLNTQNSELIFTETYNIPADGTRPFTITNTAGSEGTVTLIGKVRQNDFTLVEITDQYEVARPNVSVTVSVPDVVGNEPFQINVEMKNTGKVDATLQFGVQGSEFGDSQNINLSSGETKLLQYSQQITKDVTYTFTFAGDLEQTVTKTLSYGIGASIQFGVGSLELGVFPEGSIPVPVTLANTGRMDESLEVVYQLTTPNAPPTTVTKTYYLPIGGSTFDTFYFNLTEGPYQITANSQLPTASAQAGFSVRKENKVEMTASLGVQTDGLIPVTVNLTNAGYNEIGGSLQLSAINSQGTTVWNGLQDVSLPYSQAPSPYTQIFYVNPSALPPGDYTLKAELLNNSSQAISVQSMELGVQSAIFQITQLPPYQTFTAGQEATFNFGVQNTGNQEGAFNLSFKAYDLIDSTQREWLKPGEEKPITFDFMLPGDLDEKDYFATYQLRDEQTQKTENGQVKYHLTGISLNVNASLDKPNYTEGETAHLTINIQSPNPNSQNLFARVNYAGFESQQAFTVGQGQALPLQFDVPLLKITGEKLFYGIYYESGRSIHLNSIYIHKAGEEITITTDKQVYNPGETVVVTVTGNKTGEMTLSGPGGYNTETFSFLGQTTKSLTIPTVMTAGTYFINVQLEASNPGTITVSHPFDVAGIQVKVIECTNDKGKYASSDTINTNLTISSNTTMTAMLKAWIVDPKGQYTSVGEQSINLSSSENLMVSRQSLVSTTVSGIHRLTYGIYAEELLLVSGSEAFDVGEAVLLGLSTDKRDYPSNTELVIVTVSLFGSVNADLQLELDGNVIKNESIRLNGFFNYQTQLQNILPGSHTLKATLIAGGLTSTKETSFTYAMSLIPKPDISLSPSSIEFGSVDLGSSSIRTFTITNIGNADLIIGTIALTGPNQGEFNKQNDTCSGKTITPTGSCTGDVLFSPTSVGGKSASLSIPSNDSDTPALSLALSGTGTSTLNISIDPTGSGGVSSVGIDCPGDCTETYSTSGVSVQLTATPAGGYQFISWTGDINQTENPVTVNMETNKNVTANFVLKIYTINASAFTGGTISPSDLVTVNHGGSQTFIITPSVGFRVTDVKVDGTSVGAVMAYTFSNVTTDHTIEATFAINQYTITVTAGQNGTISPSGPVTVNYGGSQTFTITPSLDYHVADVKVDGVSVGAVSTYTFTDITANHTIEANFGTGLYILDLPRTGQITSYAQGDDGYFETGVSWPSPRFTTNPDTTVTDNLTGLVWAPDVGTPSFGSCTGGIKTWQAALDYIACLNMNNYLGYNDWRLPNVNELESLNQAGEVNSVPWLNAQGFANVSIDDYWTSTTLASSNDSAWVISIYQSDAAYDYKDYNKNIWPVRSTTSTPAPLWKTGQITSYATGDDGYFETGVSWPSPRFTTNPDTTVTDNLTGLVWASDAGTPSFESCTGGIKTWQGALDYVLCLNTNNYLGHNDWRLPNRKELRSLIHYGQGDEATWLNSQAFFNVVSGEYWSSTAYAFAQDAAWTLDMGSGMMGESIKSNSCNLLPVRAGTVCSIADAGPNVSILSEEQHSTILKGRVYVLNNGTPHSRWLEGQNQLTPWQPAGTNGECPLNLGSLQGLSLGGHTFSLEVADGKCISRDDMILTVNNSAPHPAPAGGGVCEISTDFPLTGQVSDYDGDIVDYEWLEGNNLLFGGSVQTIYGGTPVNLQEHSYQCLVLGEHTINLAVNDGLNQTAMASINISVTDTIAPTLAPVPDKNILWPPNHKMVNVAIQANARDNSGSPVTLAAVVSSNEPQEGLGDGDKSPDWIEPVIDQGNGIITLQLRAERSGSGNGRVYTITITGRDGSGNSSQANVEIIVPHDRGKK